MCVDWLNNEEPRDDPALRGEKDPKTGYRVELPHRKVGVSSTQVSCIATETSSVVHYLAVLVIHGSDNVGVVDF